MRRALQAELVKMAATPTNWWLLAAALGLVGLVSALTVALADFRSPGEVRSLLSFGGSGGFVALLMGVVAAAGEHRHRTIVAAVLITPQRARVVGAQAVAYAGAGLALGLLCTLLNALVSFPGLDLRNVEPGLGAGDITRVYLGGVLYTTLSATLGVGLGALARNQVAAVGAVLVVFSAVDPALSALVPQLGKFGLTGIGIALSGGTPDEGGPFTRLLPTWAAAAVYLAYTGALVGAGTWATVRRDVR